MTEKQCNTEKDYAVDKSSEDTPTLPVRLARLAQVRKQGLTKRRQATQNRLLQAASDIVAKQGVFGTSVEQICEQAGFTRGAFYSNFSDIDDLLAAVVRSVQEQVVETLKEARQGLPEALAEVRKTGTHDEHKKWLAWFVSHWIEALPLDKQSVLLRAEINSYALRNESFRERVAQARAIIAKEVQELLEEAFARLGRASLVEITKLSDQIVSVVDRAALDKQILYPHREVADSFLSTLLVEILDAMTRLEQS